MFNWLDIIRFAKRNNPTPPHRVIKSDDEWRKELTEEQYRVTRLHGTERPHQGEFCESFEPAMYGCVCCGTPLFDSREKFESGTGWPSFTQPVLPNGIKYIEDRSHGMRRIEVQCNVCDAHLGHVFPDGPEPSGLRYCVNSASLRKLDNDPLEKATIGGGCFWCTEAIFNQVDGVLSVTSGYSAGHVKNPTYRQVTTGETGHAEVVQIIFDKSTISYDEILRIHLHTHNPTTLNQQGADKGPQYRSIILYHNDEQKNTGQKILQEEASQFDQPIVTELEAFEDFYAAEDYHQDYYDRQPNQPYCQVVINPKLSKLRSSFKSFLKS